MILSFDDFELDTDLYELRQNGQLRQIEPLVFNLIAHFARNPNRVISRDDLIESVWAGRIVSDATVSTCIKNARKALGEGGDTQAYLKTVRGRGFRFMANVAQLPAQNRDESLSRAPSPVPVGNSDPSLLVLPFRVLADNPELGRVAECLTTDLTTVLTRIPLLRLSAQTTRYAGQAITPTAREIYDDLGVDYILEGHLRDWDDHCRINAQLSDAKSGFCLWAEQFTITGPVSALLNQGVIAIIAKLEPQLYRAIYTSVRGTGGEPTARKLFLEASSILALKGWHHESFSAAADLLRRSWTLDSEFALAASYLSLVLGFGERVGLMSDPVKAKQEALEAAERALQLDNMDSTVLGFSGCALADIGYIDRALPILKNAVELNPANAQAWAALGSVCMLHKQLDDAIAHLSHSIKISPLDSRLSIWGALLAIALMLSNDLDGAHRQGELACQRDDRCYLPRIVLATVHLVRGDHDSAARVLNDAYRIKPDLSPRQVISLAGRKRGDDLLKLR